jgi:hypothetical protein
MAITLVASTVAEFDNANPNSVTTGAIDTTTATLLVMVVSSYEAVASPTVSDSASNASWQGLTAQGSSGSAECRMFYHANPSTSATHTFTAAVTTGFLSVAVFTFAGTATSLPFDLETGTTVASVATIQPGSLTPSADDYVVINGIAWQSANTWTIDGGYSTPEQLDFASGLYFGVAGAYLIQTSAAASNPTWTGTNAVGGCVQASFKVGSAPAAPTNRYLTLLGVG